MAPITIEFTATPKQPHIGDTITFTNISPQSSIDKYTMYWNFGDPAFPEDVKATTETVTYTYVNEGTYEAKLTAYELQNGRLVHVGLPYILDINVMQPNTNSALLQAVGESFVFTVIDNVIPPDEGAGVTLDVEIESYGSTTVAPSRTNFTMYVPKIYV